MFQIAYLPVAHTSLTENERYYVMGYFAGISASYWIIPGTYYDAN